MQLLGILIHNKLLDEGTRHIYNYATETVETFPNEYTHIIGNRKIERKSITLEMKLDILGLSKLKIVRL